MSVHHASERLFSAVSYMAGSSDRLQQRLRNAYCNYLMRMEGHLPDELQREFLDLEVALTRERTAGSEGTVQATTSTMSEEEARGWIHRIVWLYDQVCKMDPENESHPAADGS